MSINSMFAKVKSKIAKFFFKKDKNIFMSLIIGLIISIIMIYLFLGKIFADYETNVQALIYQFGYKLPKDPTLVTIVKKDQTTSRLINKAIGRREYASIFNFLGQRQKKEIKQQKLDLNYLMQLKN